MYDPIFQIFRDETKENLSVLEQGLLDLEHQQDQTTRQQLVDKLFRHAHNVKGDARALDLPDLQRIAGDLEELLETFRQNPTGIHSELTSEGLNWLDRLRNEFQRWEQEIFSVPAAEEDVPFPSSPDASGKEPAHAPATQQIDESAQGSRSALPEESFSVRVSSEILDRMLNLAGEVRVLQRSDSLAEAELKDLRERLDELRPRVKEEDRELLENAMDQFRRVESELHHRQTRKQTLMQSLEMDIRDARMLPLSMLTDSLRRPSRDLALSLDKEIHYQAEVGDVLLDKGMIESLRTPLLHLLRNAIDHGIEAPSVRQEMGKAKEGTIRLSAFRRGTRVRIQVSDDGAGLNFGKIRERLIGRGILDEEETNSLTHEQLSDWLFHPGFSTTEVGEVSGRGVGLDIVRSALQRIQGKISLTATPAQGTTFTLSLPVNISTVRILTVWCHGQSFGIPTESVVGTGRIRGSQLTDLKGSRVVTFQGEPVRWIPLSAILQLQRSRNSAGDVYLHYLIIHRGNQLVALHVDDIGEEREVLLKPLGCPLSGMPGIFGGTILPDGTVQLVLDLDGEGTERKLTASFVEREIPSLENEPQILVVDDSPTTRALLRNVFLTAGYRVLTAADGVEAIEKLRVHRPDLVVCDFEMPRMNGVDLTRQIKSRWNLPVILVTGREQEHHRREGLEAGADAYLVKSTFQGDSLMEIVRQFIGKSK